MAAPSLFFQPRLLMDLRQAGLPSALSLGRYNYRGAQPGLRAHSHGLQLEICYLVKGRQTYRVRGVDYHLRGGDVFLAFPHEWHGTGGSPEEKGVLYWLAVAAPDRHAPFFGLPPRQGQALWRALRDLPCRHFPGTSSMKDQLDAITLAFAGGDDPLRAVKMHSFLLAFLLELTVAGRDARPRPHRSLESVLRYIGDHLDEPPSVPQLARMAGLSTAYFKARFEQETGIPPAEYLARARIEEARRRLAAGRQSVTDVAFALGFSSSQYFATVFKRITGQNPRDLIRKPDLVASSRRQHPGRSPHSP